MPFPELGPHWLYYRNDYDWDDARDLVRPDPDTVKRLIGAGVSEGRASALWRSGFAMVEGFDVVVDRYYGGALISQDGRTRFSLRDLVAGRSIRPNDVWVKKAGSLSELRDLVGDAQSASRRRLLFRGQTASYVLDRLEPNPALQVRGIGEISLVPSVWRRMGSEHRHRAPSFSNLSLFEWSKVLYARFDMVEVERLHQQLLDSGQFVTPDMLEDCDEPLLREFGRFRMELSLSIESVYAPGLLTLLQHYGLCSPMLDLTTNLDVAVFFATHSYRGSGASSSYVFGGTNGRKAVVYLLRENEAEMYLHERQRVLDFVNPRRPVQQCCVVAGSSSWAMNLPADFLIGIVELDFDLDAPVGFSTADLFPGREIDPFLDLLLKKEVPRITEFAH